MICRHTSRFPVTGTSRKINENARPSGVGENSGKTKVHIISSGSNDNGALPLFRQSFCVHAHRLSFCRPGSLPSYHPLSLRSPGGAGILNLPLKTNFTKKFRSPLEIGRSQCYLTGIGLRTPDSQAAVVPSNGTTPNSFMQAFYFGLRGCLRTGETCDSCSNPASLLFCPRTAEKNYIKFV